MTNLLVACLFRFCGFLCHTLNTCCCLLSKVDIQKNIHGCHDDPFKFVEATASSAPIGQKLFRAVQEKILQLEEMTIDIKLWIRLHLPKFVQTCGHFGLFFTFVRTKKLLCDFKHAMLPGDVQVARRTLFRKRICMVSEYNAMPCGGRRSVPHWFGLPLWAGENILLGSRDCCSPHARFRLSASALGGCLH